MTVKKNQSTKTTKKPKAKEGEIVEVESTDIEPVIKQQSLAPSVNSAEALISQAIAKETPVETMEKLMAMRRELKAEFAKEKFDEAMANFQGECPTIKKKKDGAKTKAGVVAYKYAPLESIVEQVKEIIKNNNFSYLIKTDILADKSIKATCVVKHKLGHSEESAMTVPLGTSTGVMSASQVTASATTFAKRYAFCNAFGIMTGDDDDDARNTGLPTTAPPAKPAPPVETPAQQYYKATKMISSCNNADGLIAYTEMIDSNKSFNIFIAKQKKDLKDLCNARVDVINSK